MGDGFAQYLYERSPEADRDLEDILITPRVTLI